MTEIPHLLDTEMCMGLQLLAWATIWVFAQSNFVNNVTALSMPENKIAISNNENSLTFRHGSRLVALHSKRKKQIDDLRRGFSSRVSSPDEGNLVENAPVSTEDTQTTVYHRKVEINPSLSLRKEESLQVRYQTETDTYYTHDPETRQGNEYKKVSKTNNEMTRDKNTGYSSYQTEPDNIEFINENPNRLPENNLSMKESSFIPLSEESQFYREPGETASKPENSNRNPESTRKTDAKETKDLGRAKRETAHSKKSHDYNTNAHVDASNKKPYKTSTNVEDSLNSGDNIPFHLSHRSKYESNSSPQKHENPNKGRSRTQRQTSSSAGSSTTTNSKTIRARQEGDAIIGALFPLHQAPTQKMAFTRQCGEIREYYGIQRVEAFLMTIQRINENKTILPNIKLGWDIRDSCWYSAIALENSIDFIKDAIASQSRHSDQPNDHGNVTSAASSTNRPLSSPASSSMSSKGVCHDNKHLKPIVGLVGPGSSEVTIQVQNLLQIFNIPQIGYSATSMDLSDKSHYKYFLRVVPPDRYQAQAMVDIVVRFNWTYISTVHSDGNYGIRGMEKFADLAKEQGVCIATSDNVASSAEDAAFDSVIDNLLEKTNATVVVCFCEGLTMKKLFHATRRRNIEGRFLFVGSDGWGNRLDVVDGQESAAVGGISIKLYSPPLEDFGAHYSMLKPSNGSKHNPWFKAFWEQKFKCSFDRMDYKGYTKLCTGNESLAGSDHDSKLGFVVNAVTTMARALHNMHKDVCPGYEGLCPAMQPINGSVYLQYLLNVSFKSYSGEQVHFDSKGDPPGRYEILNYQPVGNNTYEYVTIGHWMTGSLRLNESRVVWPRGRRGDGNSEGIFKSVCSEPCKWGEAKKGKGVACCWICSTCLENQILVDNNTECGTCDLGMWPNLNKTDCEAIPVDFISWGDTEAIVCITLACLGICVTMWICAIFIRFHDTPIVKASTRELSYIILVGIGLAFSANFFIVAKPTKSFCYLTRILPGLSFSLMYGALVTRTNRIARILEGSKRIMTKKPRFMSATAQVVITGIIIGIECAVITGMLVYQPADSKLDYPAPRKVRLVCDTSTLGIVVPLGFDLLLILLCTIYAVKTRNLPENFNEAKFIGFTMYATCVIWLGFFPIYFAGENKEITLSISMSLSAAIALLLLFVPKVYVIVWVPEKNTRGAFTTSRDVRCHIGSKSMASGDSIDIKESSTFDNLFKSDKAQSKQWRQKSLDEKRLRFVMQRTGGADGDSAYINHGVLANHNSIKSTSFVNRDSKDSSKTELTPVSSLSCPDKERMGSIEQRAPIPGVEVIKQNLARDFPMHKRQAPLRPGSPAEKEKHRIHTVDHLVDLDELLGTKTSNSSTRHGKPGDFRKSLSSTCVSSCPKTRNAHCQTSDELVQFSLPPLRKRCVSRNKNKLERTGAVDDNASTTAGVHVFKYPPIIHSKPLTVQKSPGSSTCNDPFQSPSDVPDMSPLVVCHNYDRVGLCSLPDLDVQESTSLLGNYNENNLSLRRCSDQPCYDRRNQDYQRRRSQNDQLSHPSASSSVLPSSSNRRSPKLSGPRLLTPSASSDFSFMEGVEEFENSISPTCADRRFSNSKSQPQNLPKAGVSPSSQNMKSPVWCHSDRYGNNDNSPLIDQDSNSSTTISTASSSFTLPPFHTSTDSNASQQTFGDTDDNFDLVRSNDHLDSISNDRTTATQSENPGPTSPKSDGNLIEGDNTLIVNSKHSDASVAPLQKSEKEDEDVEFHRYLQGHGVKLDLSTVQSSDL